MNQNELERRVENSRLSIFRSHVRSTFIIAAKGSYHAARKKVCCCTQQQTTNFLVLFHQTFSYFYARDFFHNEVDRAGYRSALKSSPRTQKTSDSRFLKKSISRAE